MQFKLLGEGAGQRIFVVILAPEEAVVATLTRFVQKRDLTAASVTAIELSDALRLDFSTLSDKTITGSNLTSSARYSACWVIALWAKRAVRFFICMWFWECVTVRRKAGT